MLSYALLGLTPLVALWVGLAIVGASMALTPSRGPRPSAAVLELLETFSRNVSSLLESLRLGSGNLYVSRGSEVYVVASLRPVDPEADLDLDSAVKSYGDNVVVVFRSPVSGDLVGEVGDVCSSVEYVTVDLLGIARGVRCVSEGRRTVFEFAGVKVGSPYRMSRVMGSIYGVIAASVKALAEGRAVLLLDEELGSSRRVVVEGVARREGAPG